MIFKIWYNIHSGEKYQNLTDFFGALSYIDTMYPYKFSLKKLYILTVNNDICLFRMYNFGQYSPSVYNNNYYKYKYSIFILP